MPGKPESFHTSQLSLSRGQSYFAQLPRGAVLRVAAGSVALVQRLDMERSTLVLQTPLGRGAVHCVDVSSWVEIVGQSDAELVVMLPQARSLVRALFGRLAVAWGRLGRQRRARPSAIGHAAQPVNYRP